MSHIVIHDDSSNVTHYAEFDDVQAAAAYLEDLVNADADSNARLFALEPVEFAVKSYVRIEIGAPGEAATESAGSESAGSSSAGSGSTGSEGEDETDVPLLATEVFTDAAADDANDDDDAVDDSVEYIEAAMAPSDPISPAPMPEYDDVPGGDVRRGLFGR